MQNYFGLLYMSLREPLGSWQSPLLYLIKKWEIVAVATLLHNDDLFMHFCSFKNKLLYLWCNRKVADILRKCFRTVLIENVEVF